MTTEFPEFDPERFCFGAPSYRCKATEAFYKRHEPIVRTWCAEMAAAGNPWWQSAKHAAYCLVSHREYEAMESDGGPDWSAFDVENFLFYDLAEGGTVGHFGSIAIFFEQLVEAVSRFVDAGLIGAELGEASLAAMRASEGRFLQRYEGCDAA